MGKNYCQKCGVCCWNYPVILLSKEEQKSTKFLMKRGVDFDNKLIVIRTKKQYIKIIDEQRDVCVYFDGLLGLCKIHENKPDVCKKFLCGIDR